MKEQILLFTCDVCGKKIQLPMNSDSPLIRVPIFAESYDECGRSRGKYSRETAEMCETCFTEYAAYMQKKYRAVKADYQNLEIKKIDETEEKP